MKESEDRLTHLPDGKASDDKKKSRSVCAPKVQHFKEIPKQVRDDVDARMRRIAQGMTGKAEAEDPLTFLL